MIFLHFLEKMWKKPNLGSSFLFFFFFFLSTFILSESASTDASVMQALKKSINSPSSLNWTDSDPCNWANVGCSNDGRVTRIQIGHQNLQGTLPSSLSNLTELDRFEVMFNQLSGPVPSFAGLNSLQHVFLSNNNFSSFPPDFFTGLTSLQEIYIDYNPFAPWEIPETILNASSLQIFSADEANIIGPIPDFLGSLSGLTTLHLAFNRLSGSLWLVGDGSRPLSSSSF